MKAFCVTDAFGMEHAAVRELPTPVRAPGQVLLRVLSASLNYRDWLVARGEYNPRFRLPLVLGSDAVAEIVELDEIAQERGFSVGDRVCPCMAQAWVSGAPDRAVTQRTLGGPLPGVLAEFLAVRADSISRVPAYLSDDEAATLPCAALTAWSALRELSQVSPDDWVLTMGSGGVALFALQIARLAGARVLSLSRTEQKQAALSELGASLTASSAAAGWGAAVRELVGGAGVDHVIEIGGATTMQESLQAVRPGGTISWIGTVGGRATMPDLLGVMMRNVRLQGVFVGHRVGFENMLSRFAEAELRPVIDRTFTLADAAEAFSRLASGDQFGKICVRIA